MWSPSFVPKCVDWPSHVDVVGDFTRIQNNTTPTPSTYVPDPRLVEFLNLCGDDKPIYIGFGSMVISDSAQLVQIIKVDSLLLSYLLYDNIYLGRCRCDWISSYITIRMDKIC